MNNLFDSLKVGDPVLTRITEVTSWYTVTVVVKYDRHVEFSDGSYAAMEEVNAGYFFKSIDDE